MRTLILIKHARPVVDPTLPPDRWRLSEEGRSAAKVLATSLQAHAPRLIVTSTEPKARETGQVLGESLHVPVQQAGDLHEHDRSNVPHMRSGDFISAIANFFRQPDRLVLGLETANQARQRICVAVDSVLADHPEGNLAIVTHGTVLALLAAERARMEPFGLWRRMGLPSFIAFEVPAWHQIDAVDRVG